MLFALFSFLLATPLSAQAQTREAYVSQSADETTLTFYYDALRGTRTGTTWGIEETKSVIFDGTFPGWAGTSLEVDTTTTRVVFDASFRDFRPTTTAKWFYDCKALKQIEGMEYLNTSEVKDMSKMFYGCSALTSIDLKHFNTQNVTNMKGMFRRCSALTSLDLKHFNTQNVTDMRIMFDDCKALKTLDLQNFNTQNVTDMYGMFWNCAALTSLDLQHFNTQNVIEMSLMFAHCLALTSLDVQNFNTQKVTNMFWMFHSCSALTSLDVQNFNTQNVTDMSGMFAQCSALTSLDVQNFNTQNVTDMSVMFSGCSALTTLNLQNFNTQNVTNMLGMFSGCSALTSLDLQHFNTQNVTNMKAMFSGCSALTSLDVQNFNTQKVTDMNWMFYACPALTTIYSNTAWRCPKSDDMFFCNPKLKGAVSYDGKNRDVMMANPETGYFTAKPTMVESYRRRGAQEHLPDGVQVVNGKKTSNHDTIPKISSLLALSISETGIREKNTHLNESATLQVCSVALFVETRGRREGIERRNRREEEGTRLTMEAVVERQNDTFSRKWPKKWVSRTGDGFCCCTAHEKDFAFVARYKNTAPERLPKVVKVRARCVVLSA